MKENKIQVLILLAVLVFGAVQTLWAASAAESVGQKNVVLSLATIYPPDQPASKAIEWAIKEIKEKSGGRITINHFPSSTMGDNNELASQLVTGAVDMNAQSLSYFEGKIPEVAMDGAFYDYLDWGHVERAWGPKGEYGSFFRKKLLDAAGVQILAPWNYGVRVITTKSVPVRHPDDLKGLKLRVPGAPIWLDQAAAWGVRATPVAFGEIYLALSQGVVDGQENPISVIYANKFHEVQKFMSLTNHKYNLIYALFNDKKWQSLSEGDRNIIKAAFVQATKINQQEIDRQNEIGIREFKAAGGTIIENPDRAAFRAAVMKLFAPDGKYARLKPMRDLLERDYNR